MSLLRCQFLSLLASSSTLAMSTAPADSPPSGIAHAAWSRQSAICELDVRQFKAAGTLRAAQADLPRLKTMGVDIVWLMPLQPVDRKATLGRGYSIHHDTSANAEFRTLADGFGGDVAPADLDAVTAVSDKLPA